MERNRGDYRFGREGEREMVDGGGDSRKQEGTSWLLHDVEARLFSATDCVSLLRIGWPQTMPPGNTVIRKMVFTSLLLIVSSSNPFSDHPAQSINLGGKGCLRIEKRIQEGGSYENFDKDSFQTLYRYISFYFFFIYCDFSRVKLMNISPILKPFFFRI